MPFYNPIPPPTPRIIITEHEDNINTVHVPWNRNILAALWIPQFFFLLLGMAIIPYEIDEIISFQTIFIGIIALGNIVLMATPLIEAHHYATGNLTPHYLLKMQRYIARWVAGSMVVIVLIQVMNSYKSAWGVVWVIIADALYLMPFMAGMWYAKKMVKETGESKDFSGDVETGAVRL
ncbi:uncharacterized protein RSE6_02926 [Rhynchosporium secalis]|uniref:Uncharacterized protein n=1 Tax=Rhynchosporium secalis TaxID=38038 RepID=A0A1E1M1G3_RHYSE|nr:uncharacterized protein RSE6_02926 [Rhynchosporium secalis]